MYFPKINKTSSQLEVLILAIELEYKPKNDEGLAKLISKYFDLKLEDVSSSITAYRTNKDEDYEQQSKKIEYARL